MADEHDLPEAGAPGNRGEASAEKAYAAAAEAVPVKPKPEESPMSQVEAAESPMPSESTMDVADPVVAAPVDEPAAVVAEPVSAPVKPRKAPAKRAAAKPVTPARKAAKPAAPKAPKTKVAAPKAAVVKPKPAPKPAAKKAAATPAPAKPQVKERKMEMTSKIKSVMTDAQDKAKAAYDKGAELIGEATEFTKGNVDAMVESGKILAAGLQDIGTTMVADTKESFETMTADVKAIAAVKSPTELVKLQGDMMRRNLDKAVAYSSKNSEAMLKLANEVFAPISGRFSLAMDKVRKAA